jgi:hypothetical protein
MRFHAMTSPTVRLKTHNLNGLLEPQDRDALALMTPGFQVWIEFLSGLQQDAVKTDDSLKRSFRTP